MDIIHHEDPSHLPISKATFERLHSLTIIRDFKHVIEDLGKTGLQWHHLYIRVCIYLWFFVKLGVQMMREIYHLIRGSQMTWGFKAFQASAIPKPLENGWLWQSGTVESRRPFLLRVSSLNSDARRERCAAQQQHNLRPWSELCLDSSITFSPLGPFHL